jgi:predicted Zn-dependent peptidase
LRVFARTETHSTRYFARATPDRLDDLVGSIGVLLDARPHTAATHRNETSAVLTELARLDDQPQLRIASTLAAHAFADLDISMPDVATPASISGLGVADVTSFRARHYRPAGTVVAVAGPHPPEEVLDRLAGVAFDTAEPQPADPQPADPDPAERPLPSRVVGAGHALVYAAPTPPVRNDDERTAGQIATELIVESSGLLARLGDPYGARSNGFSVLNGADRDLIVVAWPPHERLGELRSALRRLAEDPAGVTSTPEYVPLLATVRARLRIRLAYELQSPGGLAQVLLGYRLGQHPWPDPAGYDQVPDDLVTRAVIGTLGAARLWRVDAETLKDDS